MASPARALQPQEEKAVEFLVVRAAVGQEVVVELEVVEAGCDCCGEGGEVGAYAGAER